MHAARISPFAPAGGLDEDRLERLAEVSCTDTSFQYCPTCQTGGKPLADRRLSRLLT